MKVLALADEEAKLFYDFYRPGKLDSFDVILACGDLHREYLEFLVTMARCPLLYVCGNHDDSFDKRPPEGCICIEDRVYEYKGVRFLGLGGSNRYRPDGTHMYTERQMRFRIRKLWFALKRSGGFDVLVAHAPARHLGDLETIPHRGFECFVELMDKYKPKYFVHGHVHKNYGTKIPEVITYNNTRIINAYEFRVFSVEPDGRNIKYRNRKRRE